MPEIPDLNQITRDRSVQSSEIIPPISPDLQVILQHIVDDVVENLGCVGAMVATLEHNNCLPVRAYSIDFSFTLLKHLEDMVGVSLTGPKSVAYLDNEHFQDNLSVRAIKGPQGYPEIVTSGQLYDLFRPVVNKTLSDLAQRMTGVKQVVAVPFSIDGEVVGNLFAATRDIFSPRDIKFLTAFGNQAASAIQSQRHLAEVQALERVILALQTSITDETRILQTIADAVVQKLGYAGAIVAPREADNTLPIRAYSIDFDHTLLRYFEEQLGVQLIGPKSMVYLDDERSQNNLSVRAIKGSAGRPEIITSDSLYDLFRPVVSRSLADQVQQLTGIKQIIAVPFSMANEVMGNLFVATRNPTFSKREKEILNLLGQQAAVGLRNARLYQKTEERRQIAQMFGRMAFSAAAYIHTLRNHIGASLNYLQLLSMPQFPVEQQQKLLQSAPRMINYLGEAINILDHLHTPWHQTPDVPTDVNYCLNRALKKILPEDELYLDETEEILPEVAVHRSLSADLPSLQTSPEMLTEAFRVLIKNAVEAMVAKQNGGQLWVESRLNDHGTIEVVVRDNGLGIKPENLNKIFDMGWSTKKGEGMGFGLFWTKDHIEGLGGNIRVESVWQEGTTFYITLPTPPKTSF